MNLFDDCFLNFLQNLITFDLFLYFIVSVGIFGVVFLIKKIIFA